MSHYNIAVERRQDAPALAIDNIILFPYSALIMRQRAHLFIIYILIGFSLSASGRAATVEREEDIPSLSAKAFASITEDLISPIPARRRLALNKAFLSRDRRLIPYLVELMKEHKNKKSQTANAMLIVSILHRLSGQNFGHDAAAWQAWTEKNIPTNQNDFESWKNKLKSAAGPR